MFEKYLDDYYKSKIGVKKICNEVGVVTSTFNRYLKKNKLRTRTKCFGSINTGVIELNETLKKRYSSIVNRCNGKSTDYYGHYNGKEYMPIYEWADYCNENKELLKQMWESYTEHKRANKYAISIDRIDDKLGYTKENIQFVIQGFNSWKRNIRPIKVTYNDKSNYFLTCEEASYHYGLRRQAIGECLNGAIHHVAGYKVDKSTIKEVLQNRNIDSLEEYYNALLLDKTKKWDNRKRWKDNDNIRRCG